MMQLSYVCIIDLSLKCNTQNNDTCIQYLLRKTDDAHYMFEVKSINDIKKTSADFSRK